MGKGTPAGIGPKRVDQLVTVTARAVSAAARREKIRHGDVGRHARKRRRAQLGRPHSGVMGQLLQGSRRTASGRTNQGQGRLSRKRPTRES